MPRVSLLIALLAFIALVLPAHARSPSVQVCRTLWSTYGIQIEDLSVALATVQARPRDPGSLARVKILHEDLRRTLAKIVISGCI